MRQGERGNVKGWKKEEDRCFDAGSMVTSAEEKKRKKGDFLRGGTATFWKIKSILVKT